MSQEIYEHGGLYVTQYVGPASEGEDRQRWQITIVNGEYVELKRRDLRRLVKALRDALGDD